MLLKLLILACAVSAISCATECGTPAMPPNEMSTYIVGGIAANENSWPWMVEVLRDDGHWCGGTLISNEDSEFSWIVSAAHCFASTDLTRYKFSVGGHWKADVSEGTRQTKVPLEIIRHENYNDEAYTNDIAIIRVDRFEFNDYVSHACLTDQATAAETMAYVTGWGAQEKFPQDKELQQVNVPIVSQWTCSQSYPGKIDDTMICAGYPAGEKDACQGDSGGPMVVKNAATGKWELVGVVSWGIGCADPGYYGVYADAAYFSQWIGEKTGLYPA